MSDIIDLNPDEAIRRVRLLQELADDLCQVRQQAAYRGIEEDAERYRQYKATKPLRRLARLYLADVDLSARTLAAYSSDLAARVNQMMRIMTRVSDNATATARQLQAQIGGPNG